MAYDGVSVLALFPYRCKGNPTKRNKTVSATKKERFALNTSTMSYSTIQQVIATIDEECMSMSHPHCGFQILQHQLC